MLSSMRRHGVAVFLLIGVAACGGGGGGGGSTASSTSATSTSTSTSSTSSSGASSSASSSTVLGTDAAAYVGASTPLQIVQYGVRNNSAPLLVNGLHDPSNYRAAPVMPTWQFATVDPTGGALTIERESAPANGWHAFTRKGPVTVTGGANAAANRVYTVFNGQQLIAALNEAGNEPKIVRVVGHIDLRWSNGNSVFKEYTSYSDQKFGGSIAIPSNTTLVGINDAAGNPARITGTSILIGGELTNGGSDPESDFKAWITAGKDGDDYPTWTRNVIVRNLRIDTPWDVNPEDSDNAYADGITLSRAQNIWIDHISISDGDTPDSLATDTRHDGALDVVRGSDYVTLSNNYIEKHHKTTLVGNGDSGRAWSDQDRLHVTMTGMWWSGTASRLPLVRFGQLHLYNNLIEGSTTTGFADLKYESGLDVRYMSNVINESNYYSFTGLKPSQVCGKLVMGGAGKSALGYRSWGIHRFISDKDDSGKAWATVFSGPIDADLTCASETLAAPATGDAWLPPYGYTAVSADLAFASIKANAGAGRIGNFAIAGTGGGAFTSASSASSSAGSSTSSASSSAASSVSSTPAGTTGSWSETFSASNAAAFFTTTYAAVPGSPTLAMYVKTGGTVTVASGELVLNASRFTIGALGTALTSGTSTPGGIFTIVGKACTFTMTVSTAGTGVGKKFQVLVDNNGTSAAASQHGSASKVVEADASTLVVGSYSYTFSLATPGFTSGSFLQLRTETGAAVGLTDAALSCI